MSNLSNLFIDESFQKLTQISGSALADGTGSLITSLDITASHAQNATQAASATSASYALTASFALNVTDPTWNNITGKPAGLVSGSSQVILQDTTGDLSGSRITGAVANATNSVSSSYAVSATSSSFANTSISSSHSLTADTSISSSHALVADQAINATNSQYADNTIVTGKNISGIEIAKGTPLYFTGSGTSGNLVGVYPADAANPLRMPAAGIAGEDFDLGAEGIVILDGFINEVDTSAFNSGDAVFVAAGGGYTNQRPTGSTILVQALGYVEKSAVNGSGVIQGSGRANDVPNIQEGYGWFGNADGVATAQSTASFAKTDKNNVFTGTQTFDNISVNGTGSFAYIQSVTGSAKIIGDAYIILNNDTPAERYAGIKVIDSGSTNTTASLQFDGATNDWFYEYEGDDPTNHGVVLFGPEYATKGTPAYPTNNTIQKGNGGHHLLDSSITDDGSKVTVAGQLEANGITGSLVGNVTGNASSATSASYALTASHALNAGEWDGQYSGSAGITGSLVINGDLRTNYGTTPSGTEKDISNWNPVQDQNGNTFNLAHNLLTDYTFGPAYRGAWGVEYWDSYSYTFGNEFYISPTRTNYVLVSPSGRSAQDLFRWVEDSADPNYNTTQKYITADNVFFQGTGDRGGSVQFHYTNPSGSAAASSSLATFDMGQNYGDSTRTSYSVNANDIGFGNFGPQSGDTAIRFGGDHSSQIYFNVSGSTLNLDKDFGFSINTTDTRQIFLNSENQIQVSGSLNHIHGNAFSAVNTIPVVSSTGSLDFTEGNMFTLSLSGNTQLNSSTVIAGQTISLKVVNGGSHTLTFGSAFKFAGGTPPTITPSGTDILTFISFDGTTIDSTAVQNLL